MPLLPLRRWDSKVSRNGSALTSGSGCNVGDDDSGVPCGTFGVQRFEDVEAHDDLTSKNFQPGACRVGKAKRAHRTLLARGSW